MTLRVNPLLSLPLVLCVAFIFGCDGSALKPNPCGFQQSGSRAERMGPDNLSANWTTGPNAYKYCHTEFTLLAAYDFSWDYDKAYGLNEAGTTPPITFTFGTVMGYFPASLEYRRESDPGFSYWWAETSQAAKNEPGGDNITYNIDVHYDMERAAEMGYPIVYVEAGMKYYTMPEDDGG